MPSICSLFARMPDEEKFEFLYKLFLEINAEVKQILLYGPCNTPRVQKANNLCHALKNQGKFFPIHFQKNELSALPTVFAQNLLYSAPNEDKEKAEDIYENYLQLAQQYGTGTCEFFSIVGAYLLAKKFDINLSIETIFSRESHTYIRLHTQPEYILDFWAEMVCEYHDEITWLEVLGPDYHLKDATYKTELTLRSNDLIAMGERVFTETNARIRSETLDYIKNKVEQFFYSMPGISSEISLTP